MYDEDKQLVDRTAEVFLQRHPDLRGVYDEASSTSVKYFIDWEDSKGWHVLNYSDITQEIIGIAGVAIPPNVESFVKNVAVLARGRSPFGHSNLEDWDALSSQVPFADGGVSINTVEGELNLVQTGIDEMHLQHRLGPESTELVSEQEYYDGEMYKALRRLHPDNPEITEFIEEAMGQAMIGNPASAVLVLVGDGGNGKSFLMTAIDEMFGTFSDDASKDIYITTSKSNDKHPTGLVHLEKVRISILRDLPSGNNPQWNMDIIKLITGGDKLKVRGMGENFRRVKPRVMPVIAGNTMPSFPEVDEAAYRRFWFIPHNVRQKDVGDLIVDVDAFCIKYRGHMLRAALIGLKRYYEDGGYKRKALTEHPILAIERAKHLESQNVIVEHFQALYAECEDSFEPTSSIAASLGLQFDEYKNMSTNYIGSMIGKNTRALNIRKSKEYVGEKGDKRQVWGFWGCKLRGRKASTAVSSTPSAPADTPSPAIGSVPTASQPTPLEEAIAKTYPSCEAEWNAPQTNPERQQWWEGLDATEQALYTQHCNELNQGG